jgi:hypothetical protein
MLAPEDIWDPKDRRALLKEFRAAGWEGRRVVWAEANLSEPDRGEPASLVFTLQATAPVQEVLHRARIGLSHLVGSVRRRFPMVALQVAIRGQDGVLVLRWQLDVTPAGVAESLLGRRPTSDQTAHGHDWWRERDGGTRFLDVGHWRWEQTERSWRADEPGQGSADKRVT